MDKSILRALGAAVALMATGWPAVARAPQLAAVRGLETGEWELRGRGRGAETRRLCISDPRQLLQVQHPGPLCRAFVIADSAQAVSVNYDCGDAGNGRSDLRVETGRLIQLRSQGISDGAPFAFAAEGRRIGACR
ncbi:hypothetical protein J3E64_003307 [Sphingobium sp. OAS761]|uniref:DUF3617 domain-containing protein n=1 Tax=Sphingobium sp. OAS761 TaxID=2817901 RepID=UPI0020A11D77|nr:hypothetical protein [Sphingobium sp. OAS761]MCP1471596.1 hypothetical protein [Sphingobium sp. OAS761]